MNHKTYIIKAALCLPFLLFSTSSFPMLSSFLKVRLMTPEQKKHEKKLQEIKNITTVSAIDTAIDAMKNNVYKECLTELESITNTPYNDLLQTMNDQRTLAKKALQKNNPSAIQNHDEDIPQFVYDNTIKIMLKDKINPNNINLTYMTSPKNKPKLLADSRGGFLQFNTGTYHTNPQITFYSTLSEHPKSIQIFTIHHELQHLYLQHNFMDIIMFSLSQKNNITLSSSHKNKLTSIQEREADIHAASTNLQMAHAGMQDLCTNGHAQIIDNKNHCKDMQIMYALMKQKAQLTTLES